MLEKTQMLYYNEDYYNWKAEDDHDNPYYISGADFTELSRTQGYEVLYFINHIVSKHWTANYETYHKIERMIRYFVPGSIRAHKKIEEWIVENWDLY